MKHSLVPALARERLASFVLALVLFGLELLLLTLLLLLVYLRATKMLEGLDWLLLPVAGTLAANSWAMGRTVKNSHFLWLYGRWPELDGGSAAGQEQEQVLWAARHAFMEAEFARLPGLLSRLDAKGREDGLALALGRSLALDGRMDEARDAMLRLEGAEERRRLLPQRLLGMDLGQGPYFRPADAQWARRWRPLLGLGACLLVAGSIQVSIAYQTASGPVAKLLQGFDGSDFVVEEKGSFTFHYHDPEFRDLVRPIAEEALAHHLAFLGLRSDAFAPGQIKLYLCDTREEYGRRAPMAPAWEAASAQPRENAIYLYRMADNQQVYFEVVVAHELCHLAYHKLVPQGSDDAWLNEGLAEHMGYLFALERAGIARQAWLMSHDFKGLREKALPFAAFFQADPRSMEDSAKVAIFYKQGFSVVYMLLEHFGREPFLSFLKTFGSTGKMDESLKKAYPSIKDIDALGAVWGLFFPPAESKLGS